MRNTKNEHKENSLKKTLCEALRTFALSVGVTALCMLATVSLLGLEAPEKAPAAAEASAFNNARPVQAPVQTAAVEEGQVIPLGEAFGIKLFTDGVIVASLSDIYTSSGVCCPAAEAGLLPGDYLLQADGMEIGSNADLAHYIGKSQGADITFLVRRGDKDFEATVKPVFGEGSFKTGMWVRDSAAGVGTLTFYDPATGCFAGLGHGICDADAGSIMSLKAGEPARITLCGIIKGQPDTPGQLRGYFSSDQPMGRLLDNNETGVYGALAQAPQGQPMTVMGREEVAAGPVRIMASIDSGGPQLYDAEIVKINSVEQSTRNFTIRVTDQRLLEATGGIVQGMSGAVIIQNDKIAGAVTHVFTDDPTMGYGIFAETMLEQCRTISGRAKQNAA